ncbi:MAG: radical SAM protein [Azoarcus sp.]|jgi:anaerobic ribonucleoside-triphosphate reductase activating protein|nr:radical SAM protein [Azoarcus sp.]
MKATALRLNKAHYPVTTLGHGRRIGLWLQGCSIRCKGCVSMDTWDTAGGGEVDIAVLLAWCEEKAREGGMDGITLSGGEPFDQPRALDALLDALLHWRECSGRVFDLLCYSGYPLGTLAARHAALLAKLDAIIPEPYADRLAEGGLWRGSANQPLVPLTALGQQRYAGQAEAAAEKRMQVAVEGGKIWMIGIPRREDMARLEALCAARGLHLDQVSWRR